MSVSRRSSAVRAIARTAVLAAVLAGAHPALSTAGQSSQPPVVTAADLVTVPAAAAEDVEIAQDELAVPTTAAGAEQAPAPAPEEAPLQRRSVESESVAPKTVAPKTVEPDAAAETGTEAEAVPEVVAQLSSTRTEDFGLLGVTWDAGTAGADLGVQVRTRTGETWTPWEDVDVEEPQDEGAGVREGTAPIWVGQSDGVAARLLSAHAAPSAVRVELIDGGTGLARPVRLERSPDDQIALMSATVSPEPTATATDTTMTATTEQQVAQPIIVRRGQWGVDTSTESSCSTPVSSRVLKGVVIHHTAGANGYSRDESPGIVRAIHRYHTKSLGWCDIGYNFLVDAYGTIYQGRRGGILRQIRGAHAGNWDVNTYTTGISMMGNFELVDVPQAMRQAVVRLTAWRLNDFGLDAYGKYRYDGGSIETISGHRDVYLAGIRPATATACPGKYGYAWVDGTMRAEVQAVIDAAPTVLVPTDPHLRRPTAARRVTDPQPDAEADSDPHADSEPHPHADPHTHADSDRDPDDGHAAAAYGDRATACPGRPATPRRPRSPGRPSPRRTGRCSWRRATTTPDALSGGPAAAGQRAPVLLTAPDGIPAETVAELQRLEPSRIYILGGRTPCPRPWRSRPRRTPTGSSAWRVRTGSRPASRQ